MGTTLTGTQINNTYEGLLKTTDNAVIGATEKVLTDGAGNETTLSVGTSSASFTGTLDLTGATVLGVGGGTPGLVAGTGTNSMKSADFLTTSPAIASNTQTIAMGHDAQATGLQAIAIGQSNDATAERAIAIGWAALATGDRGVAIQESARATASRAVGIGQNAWATAFRAVAIGNYSQAIADAAITIGSASYARANNAITIGNNAVTDDAIRVDTVVIGANTKAAQYSTAVGAGAFAIGANCVALGDATAAGNNAVAIGQGAAANFNNTVAIGYNVSAVNWADSTTVNNFVIANYASLNYLDNTAAAAGGVPLGGVYHTDGNLKVRHT